MATKPSAHWAAVYVTDKLGEFRLAGIFPNNGSTFHDDFLVTLQIDHPLPEDSITLYFNRFKDIILSPLSPIVYGHNSHC